jgi:hypothetical protein
MPKKLVRKNIKNYSLDLGDLSLEKAISTITEYFTNGVGPEWSNIKLDYQEERWGDQRDYYLVGLRLETDEEQARREKIEVEDAERREKIEKEQYEKLKRKYGEK